MRGARIRDAPVGGEPALRSLVARGLRWTLASQVAMRAATFVTGIVMARLLAPHDFGVFAVALAGMTILLGLNDLGLILAVIRQPGDVRKLSRTAITLTVGMSGVLYLLCFAGAPSFASLLHTPEATTVLRVLSLVVLIDGFSAVPTALLLHDFRQDRQGTAELAGLAVNIAVGVSLAVGGAGVWALVVARLAGNTTTSLLLCRYAPYVPRPGFDRDDAHDLLAFGLPMAGASFVYFTLLNVDYMIVGRTLGTVALGFYLLAFNLSSWPANIVGFAVRRVSVPGFSRLLDDPPALRRAFSQSFAGLLAATVPMVLLLAMLALPLVQTVYGDKWTASAAPLRWLAVVGGVRVLVSLVEDLLIALGKPRINLAVQSVWLIGLVPALVLGSRHGITGVAAAHAVVAVCVAVPAFAFAAHRLGIGLRGLVAGGVRPALGGAAAVAVAGVLLAIVDGAIAQLLIVGTALLVVYVVAGVEPAWRRSAFAHLPGRSPA